MTTLTNVEELCTTSLYLRGFPGKVSPPRSRWPQVSNWLRRHGFRLPVTGNTLPTALMDAGFSEEAFALSEPNRLEWGREQISLGNTFSEFHSGYPFTWPKHLGSSAPPVLWRRGEIFSGPWVAVVGSRDISDRTREQAHQVGREIARRGLTLVSGGAVGCDLAAEGGALAERGHVVRILPCGMANYGQVPEGVTLLTVADPSEPFSTALAMERNLLIYAGGASTLIIESRFREGGTWHGAVTALRRRLNRVFILSDGSPAATALAHLGAHPVVNPMDFLDASPQERQPTLF